MLLLLRALLVLELLTAGGCAASLRGRQFHKREVDYQIGALGPEWRRRRLRGQDVLFHKVGAGAIGVHATCRGYDDVPSAVLLGHLLFGTTERRYLIDEEVTLDGRGAHHTQIDAQLDGVPVRIELYVLVRSPCVIDLSYVSAPAAGGRAEFLRFVDGFSITAVHGG